MRVYPSYTIRADFEGCCIITEYGLLTSNVEYLLSWEYYLSNPLDYNQIAQVAEAMVYSFETINTS